jgi:TonB family protein
MKMALIAVLFSCGQFLMAQNDAPKLLPRDPKAILDLTAPLYVFNAENAKPWHLSYRYRLAEDQGTARDSGKIDLWWSPNNVSRATWTRGDSVTSEWRTADGKRMKSAQGELIHGMEYRLSDAVLFHFPKAKDYESGDPQLKLIPLSGPEGERLCVALVSPNMTLESNSLNGVGTAYCFDSQKPVLVSSLMNHTITNQYSRIQSFENHNVAGHIEIVYAGKKSLEADLESSAEITADDAAFTPTPDAKEDIPQIKTITVKPGPMVVGNLLERVEPVYPLYAKALKIGGIVMIKGVIGKDGRIKDAVVVFSPHPSLSGAALEAVRQWRYKPYMLNGEPVEVQTTINLAFRP